MLKKFDNVSLLQHHYLFYKLRLNLEVKGMYKGSQYIAKYRCMKFTDPVFQMVM